MIIFKRSGLRESTPNYLFCHLAFTDFLGNRKPYISIYYLINSNPPLSIFIDGVYSQSFSSNLTLIIGGICTVFEGLNILASHERDLGAR